MQGSFFLVTRDFPHQPDILEFSIRGIPIALIMTQSPAGGNKRYLSLPLLPVIARRLCAVAIYPWVFLLLSLPWREGIKGRGIITP